MRILTAAVTSDEPCYGLKLGNENVLLPNGGHRQRLVQKTWVVRGDSLACYEEDLGPAVADFIPLIIPSPDGENTVAELWEHAQDHRLDTYWQKRKREIRESSTLIADAVRQTQEQHEIIHNRSVIGPAYKKQRNGFDRHIIEREISQRRQDYHGIVPKRGRS